MSDHRNKTFHKRFYLVFPPCSFCMCMMSLDFLTFAVHFAVGFTSWKLLNGWIIWWLFFNCKYLLYAWWHVTNINKLEIHRCDFVRCKDEKLLFLILCSRNSSSFHSDIFEYPRRSSKSIWFQKSLYQLNTGRINDGANLVAPNSSTF